MTLPDGRIRRTIQPDYSTHDGGRGALLVGEDLVAIARLTKNKPAFTAAVSLFNSAL